MSTGGLVYVMCHPVYFLHLNIERLVGQFPFAITFKHHQNITEDPDPLPHVIRVQSHEVVAILLCHFGRRPSLVVPRLQVHVVPGVQHQSDDLKYGLSLTNLEFPCN